MENISFAFAKRHGIVVTGIHSGTAMVAYSQQPSTVILAELRRYLGIPLQLTAVNEDIFSQLLLTTYETTSSSAMQMAEDLGEELDLHHLIDTLPKPEDLLESQDDAPIIRLLNALLSEAIKESASDVHIETFEERIMVRFRVDGVLREILEPQRILAPFIVSRIKIMAKLDIAEKRLPQDGRITLRIGGHAVDVRVSTMPTSHGERIVLRLLDKKSTPLDLAELGMEPKTLQIMKQLIAIPHGIILVTGPTGSGKTTTLYAALSALNNYTRNILTVEDPIEYNLDGIGQIQVNYKVNMSFAKSLRAILRQDPDIVMVGEIRDAETAQIAIQASLTGHLVLSTLHTNSAIGAITRLGDMNIESFLLASSLIGVLAQRLIRLLCRHCKKAQPATTHELAILGLTDNTTLLYQPVGCTHCKTTGYAGRSGIYELIAIDEALRTMIHDKAPEQQIQKYAHGLFPSMQQDGFKRVLTGDTSLAEILRVTTV
jgi:general secretion pathway protein E